VASGKAAQTDNRQKLLQSASLILTLGGDRHGGRRSVEVEVDIYELQIEGSFLTRLIVNKRGQCR